MSLSIESAAGPKIGKLTFVKDELALRTDSAATNEKKYINLLLDSGAFSAWKKGETININEYIDYIKRNIDWIELYATVDKIPGVPGRYPTPEEVEHSASISYKNQQIMKDAGLSPLPIFHQGEEFHWLDKYLEDEPYIGISPQEDLLSWRGMDPAIWLDKVFTRLTTANGAPIVKTHGFGVSSHALLRRYPWTSVDSTTWTWQANMGAITCPHFVNDKPDYLADPIYVHVSPNTKREATNWTSMRDKSKIQFGNLSRAQQDQVIRYVEDLCGLTMTHVRYCDGERRKVLLHYWQNVVKALGDHRTFKHRTKGSFWL